MDVAGARRANEEQSRRWHTWHIAAMPNAKKFPKFDEFVKPAKADPVPYQNRKQSADAQIAALKSVFEGRRKR